MSLANKYRPIELSQVIGQKNIVETLNNQIQNNELAQCLLFQGPAGTGKTTIARIIATMLNAELHEIDAASNNGVDFVRNMQEQSIKKSITYPNKVFLIDEVHGFTQQAWQAMLKLLEEPPAHTYFILCTTETHKIPFTILSRVQCYAFTPISVADIIERLKYICDTEQYNYSDDGLKFIAEQSFGCLREALSKLDVVKSFSDTITEKSCSNALGIQSKNEVFDFVLSMCSNEINRAIRIIKDVANSGASLKVFLTSTLYQSVELFESEKYDYMNIPRYLDWCVKMIGAISTDVDALTYIEANIIIYMHSS